jgi:hypothetical protein
MTIGDALRTYYSNERAVSYAFIVFATVSMIAGGLLVLGARRPASAIGWPLVAVGLLLAIGGAGYLRQVTQKQERALPLSERDPSAYQREESQSIQTTATRYQMYRSVEVALLLVGVALALYGAAALRGLWLGVGLGLAIEALGAFSIDSFGAYHTATYKREVAIFEPAVNRSPEQPR